MRTLKGVIPVVQTPMSAPGVVDPAAQKALINFLVDRGVGGMWCLGTGSEDMDLTYEQRLVAAQAVTEANAGRVPLVLGAGFFSLADIRRFIADTADLTFDAYHVMPYHPLLSEERLIWFYQTLADRAGERAGRPLWLYTSGNWSLSLSFSAVQKLRRHPNIAGIKYSTSNAPKQAQMLILNDEGFPVLTAVVRQFLACLSLGSPGTTTSLAGALPELVQDIYNAFSAGDMPGALAAQRVVNTFLDGMPSGLKRDNFLTAAEEKYILSLRGICSGTVSTIYRSPDDVEQLAIKENLQVSGVAERIGLNV